MSESRNKDQNTYYTIFKSFLAMSENSKILVLQDFYKNIHADMLWLYLDDYVDTESGNQEEQKHQIIFDSLIDLIEKELKKIEEVKREEVKKADNIAFRETILTKNGQQKEEDKIDLIRHSNLEDAFDLNHGKVISYDQFKESLVKKRFLDLNQIKINVLKYIMLSNERKLELIQHQLEFKFLDLKRRMEKKREIIQLELLSAQAGMLIAIALMTTSPVLGFLALAAFITSAAFIHSELNSINQKIREVGIEIEAVRGGNSPYLRQIKEEFDTEAKKYTDRYNYTDVMNFYKNHVSGKMSKTEITKKIGLEFLDSANKELGNQNLFGRVRDIQLNEA